MELPWSGNQLKKLSRHIRDDSTPADGLPSYDDVMLWFNDLAAQVQQRIGDLDWSPLLDAGSVEITSRAKTIDTLRQKLVRDPATPLPFVQDIAGVRFEAEMSLDQQDAVAGAIAAMYDQGPESVKDLRDRPHSGYRAVHIWLRLPARVEVQVRTHLQGAWANAYEAAADVLGREIRYGALPENPVSRQIAEVLQDLSVGKIASAELERGAIQRDLLSLQQDSSDAPVFSQQLQARLEQQWDQRRAADQEIRDALESIHDRFRSMHGRE